MKKEKDHFFRFQGKASILPLVAFLYFVLFWLQAALGDSLSNKTQLPIRGHAHHTDTMLNLLHFNNM